MKKLITTLIVLISIISSAQNIDKEKIDALIASKLQENEPALFVGIVKEGKIVYENYLGLANMQHQVKANEKTRSNIASTAKQFTALMILDLSLKNQLNLEDDFRKFLPNFYPDVKEEIKIRHLLNHSSGVRDFYDLMSIQQDPWWRSEGLSNDDALELLAKQNDLAFTPGSRYMYSNSGYTILCKIISEVSGTPFHEYSKKFFTDLGMKNTEFLKNYMHIIPNQAQPYSDWGDGIWQEYPMITNLYGDGFLFTTLKDQLIYEQAIQRAKKTNNELLLASQEPIPNSEIESYGFGLEFGQRQNYKAVHHSGGTGSFHSQMVRYPEEGLSIFVMSNNSTLWSGGIANEITNLILPKKNTSPKYNEKINNYEKKISEANLIGQYLSPRENIIRITLDNGKLYWQNANNNPRELVSENSGLFSFKASPRIKLGIEIGDAQEPILTLFYPDADVRDYKKISSEEVTIGDLQAFEGTYFSEELDVSFTISMTSEEKLMIVLDGKEGSNELEVLNKNNALLFDYMMKVERDVYDRVVRILLTTNRALNIRFDKKTNLKFQPTIEIETGTIGVTTIGAGSGDSSQILLTKNYPNGNEIWSRQFGGKSYDKSSSIISTSDGYLIIGSTSSFGNGNYDMFVIKTDKKGKKIWQNTYGGFYNEYGYSAEKTSEGYLIKGTVQKCSSNTDVLNRACTTNVWFVSIDEDGGEISNKILEEISRVDSWKPTK